jgi:polyisoprenoid-binding protein YceI
MKTSAALLALLLATATLASAQTETYEIDPVHSTVAFKIRHLGISWVNGNFADITGTVVFDPANPEKSSAEVKVQAASVDTRNGKRDTHLKSPDFFDAEKHGALTFKSTKVRKTGDKTYEITGDFSLLGVTKPLTITFTDLGTATGMQGEARRGGETSFSLKRSTFGMTKNVGPIGDDVEVTLAFSGVKKS